MDERRDVQRNELIHAVDAALQGRWDAAHDAAQRHEGVAEADWLHAVLHKIEGDTGNSRYWYGRTRHGYDDFSDTNIELLAIRAALAA